MAAKKHPLSAKEARERVPKLEAALAADPDRKATLALVELVRALGLELGEGDAVEAIEDATPALVWGLAMHKALDDPEAEPKEVAAAWNIDEDLIAFAEALGPLGKIADRLRELGIGVGEREPAELAGLIVRMLG